jgi:hypothetical protein
MTGGDVDLEGIRRSGGVNGQVVDEFMSTGPDRCTWPPEVACWVFMNGMKRLRIERPRGRRKCEWVEVLPLDPRAPDVVRVKSREGQERDLLRRRALT